MLITYFGHSCFQVEIGGKKLLFDPFISPNPLANNVKVDELVVDYIILSHGHEDHVADVETIYANSQARIISNFEVISWYARKGLDRGHAMNHGGSFTFDFGMIKMVNAIHSSSMPDRSYGGNPTGFIVRGEGGSFYYAGDTALHYDMKLIAKEKLDFALLPIGDNFTMGVGDAIKAAKFVKVKKVIGLHYDTFPVIQIDHEKAVKSFNKKGKELLLPGIGETINI